MIKEKKIMDQIKDMRKVLSEAGSMVNFKEEMNNISDEITKFKEEADKCHNELKELQKVNRKSFRDYIINSKKVNKLKKEQREAFNNFVKYKNEFVDVGNTLKEKLIASGEKVPEQKKKKQKKSKRNDDIRKTQEEFIDNARIIEENVKRVEQKLKDKKKLTTQDIIAMQGKEENSN